MILLIDIGNTNITIGYSEGETVNAISAFETERDNSDIDYYSKKLRRIANNSGLDRPAGGAVCSVVPEITEAVVDAVIESFGIKPLIVNSKVKTGLKFCIKNPENLGADRIANAVAARNLYSGNLIIADFGTATTVCAVTGEGDFIGGAIMPGLMTSAEALAEKTSKLPETGLEPPKNIPGKDTDENISFGILYGHAGAVERIIDEITAVQKGKFAVIATGGFAEIISPYIKLDHINRLLTLEGLRLIYERNKDE